jgi:beta-N-acetylhexosaminidase
MTPLDKAGQLVFPHISGAYWSTTDPAFLELAGWVEDLGLGGISISIGLPHSYAAKLNELQARARVPLLVVADFESGGPGMRTNGIWSVPSLIPQGGGTTFPPTMALGAIDDEVLVQELGRITGIEARAMGVHLDFAPVLDVNSNPDNPIISTRSFGEDPVLVARLGAAFIRGARSAGLQTTGKHFPGHGDTDIDSHIALPTVSADRARLDSLELVPFKRAIEEGVDAIMTAHVAAPAILGPDSPPASLSPYFHELLRDELGFEGLVVTDAMLMGGITTLYDNDEAAILAVLAGADVVLAPQDIPGAVQAIAAAVESGRVSEERLDASVRRILETKYRAGLDKGALVDLSTIDEVVGCASHLSIADLAASRSITLPRDRDSLVPLSDSVRQGRVLSITFCRWDALPSGVAFDDTLSEAIPAIERVRVHHDETIDRLKPLIGRASQADTVLISAYLPPRAGAGSVAIPGSFAELFQKIEATGTPTVLLSFGSPYILGALPDVGTYLIAWGDRDVCQGAAARALLGETRISGRLPISLPPFHELGEGIQK